MQNLKEHLLLLKRLMTLVKPLTGVMILAIVMGSLGHLVAIAIPSGATLVLAKLSVGEIVNLKLAFWVLVICGVLRGVFHYIEQLSNHYIAFKILAIIRDKVFRAFRRLAPAKLETKDSGSMISVVTTDIELLEVFYAHTISPVAIAIVVCTTVFAIMWHYHVAYALLIGFIYFVLSIVVPVVTYNIGKETGDSQRKALSHLNNIILDTFRGIKECIQFRYKERALENIEKGSESLNALSRKLSDYMGTNFGISLAVVLSSYVFFVALGGWLYQRGEVGIEGFIVPIVLAISSYGPSLALSSLANNMMLTLACGRRVFGLLEEEPTIADNTTGERVDFEDLDVSEVSFGYGEKKILDNITFSLKKNEMIGIRGKSGTGKSTLLKLIMRYYDPQKGSLEMNKVNLKDLETANLRENESFVAQHTYIFKDTIRKNLLVAKEDATDEDLDKACKKASIYDFIQSLPNGYDTYAGELGERFSAGEKQRLGLARAFLHDAPLMLFDEPTANIDSLNEGEILRAIDKERANKAICIVSHRPSTFRIVDRFLDVIPASKE